jgi:uncharacterized membrane protein YqhA
MKFLDTVFESLLWNSRFMTIAVVVFSLLLAVGTLLVTTVDAVVLLGFMLAYLDPSLTEAVRDIQRVEVIARVVSVIDGYLIAAILIIFALGLYELFVNKINQAEGSELAERLLLIRSLDDLKDRLANMVLLILVVKFFQQAINIKYKTVEDMLFLSLGILMIAGALYLSGRAKPAKMTVEK